ncbi:MULTISPECIES: substrate-binding domain-containing protein [Chitinophagaceae]
MKLLKLSLIAAIAMFSVKAKAQNNYQYDAPWNTPPQSGTDFTIHGIDNVPDLYGNIVDPQLVIFMGGNQYMCLDELLSTFKKAYPQYTRIFVETLPPGILYKQITTGSLTIGNMVLDIKPDLYAAGKNRIESSMDYLQDTVVYAYNKLAIMVQKNNPKTIRTIRDLQKENIRLSMPNPEWEGIGRQIEASITMVGGESLNNALMQKKRENGTTYLTKIHHRETPLRIMNNESDAGIVWETEALYHQHIGHPTGIVRIPDNVNKKATYIIGNLKNAPHKQAAQDFLNFMKTKAAKDVYAKYGFIVE